MRLTMYRVLAFAAVAVAFGPYGPAVFAQSATDSDGESELILLPTENTPDPIPKSNHLDIENYESGEEKIRREISLRSDNSLVNHGSYTEFFKNGEKFVEGQYEHGLPVGEWTYWFENGTKCKVVQYEDGVPDGEWTVFREDGTRRATRKFEHGQSVGEWLTYAEDGETVLQEKRFQDGLAHGKWVRRYASGEPHVEEHYQEGKRHGKYIERNEEGQIVRQMEFKNGRLDGTTIIRARDGREIIQYYREGQLVPEGPPAGGA